VSLNNDINNNQMNIVLNKNINHLLHNFKYCNNIHNLKSCNNLIWIICDVQQLSQIDIIKNIFYKKIFIVIDIDNIDNEEQINIEKKIKKQIDNLNNSNLFVKNKLYGWNVILDVIKNNLEKNTLSIDFIYNYKLYLVLIILCFSIIIFNQNKTINMLNNNYDNLHDEHDILQNDYNTLYNNYNNLQNNYNNLQNNYNTLYDNYNDLWHKYDIEHIKYNELKNKIKKYVKLCKNCSRKNTILLLVITY